MLAFSVAVCSRIETIVERKSNQMSCHVSKTNALTECDNGDLGFPNQLDAFDVSQLLSNVLSRVDDFLGAVNVSLTTVVDQRRPASSSDSSCLRPTYK